MCSRVTAKEQLLQWPQVGIEPSHVVARYEVTAGRIGASHTSSLDAALFPRKGGSFCVASAGDSVNDAPALAPADFEIAMEVVHGPCKVSSVCMMVALHMSSAINVAIL